MHLIFSFDINFIICRSKAAMDVIMYLITILKDHWILTTILTLTVLLYLHYIATFSGLKELGLPGPTPWPILGNLGQMMLEKKGMHIYMKHAIEKYGKVFGMYFLKAPSIVIHDPEILKHIFVKDFGKFHDRPVSIATNQLNDHSGRSQGL